MKVALFVVCLALGSASALNGGRDLLANHKLGLVKVNRFFKMVADDAERLNLRLKRDAKLDPVRCLDDTSQITGERFRTCQQIFNDNITSVTPATAQSFCMNRCPQFLTDLINKLVADCGFTPAQLPDDAYLALMLQMCDVGPGQQYCLETWLNLDPSHIQNDYGRCIVDYDGRGPCPDECKRAEDWIVQQFGCCYKSLVQYDVSQGETDGLLTDDYWTSCGKKEPAACG